MHSCNIFFKIKTVQTSGPIHKKNKCAINTRIFLNIREGSKLRSAYFPKSHIFFPKSASICFFHAPKVYRTSFGRWRKEAIIRRSQILRRGTSFSWTQTATACVDKRHLEFPRQMPHDPSQCQTPQVGAGLTFAVVLRSQSVPRIGLLFFLLFLRASPGDRSFWFPLTLVVFFFY